VSRCLSASLLLAVMPLAAASPIVDDGGHTLVLAAPAQRIVSLWPGATALLFAAGAGDRIVATADYSDEPEAARRIARIGDAQSFDVERILALHPDVVVAWEGGTSPLALARLERVGLRVYRAGFARLTELPDTLRRLGALAGTSAVADPAAAALAARIQALRARYARPARPPTVLIQVWDRPVYTVGRAQILSDVLGACGYRNVFDDLAAPAPAVSEESVLARDPDVILALAPDEASARAWLDRWRDVGALRAVRGGRLLADSDPRLSRMGPGLVPAAEALCERLAGLYSR